MVRLLRGQAAQPQVAHPDFGRAPLLLPLRMPRTWDGLQRADAEAGAVEDLLNLPPGEKAHLRTQRRLPRN